MREPSVSFRRHETERDIEVLVVRFDVGVELRIAGESGLLIAHWKTRPVFDPDVQREEVARAIEWGRLHDSELRARFRQRPSRGREHRAPRGSGAGLRNQKQMPPLKVNAQYPS